MSIDQYRDVDENLSDIDDKTSNGDSILLNQSEQGFQSTSCESGSSGNRDSPVWPYFEKETAGKLGIPICKIYKTEFSKLTATSTLARHLNIHNIIALKQGKKPLNPNPHSKIEQQE
ncbi:39849_t:CDS:1 [Gigaspora margarita]|uniref:39849_t:CDS:1 n=1 Tax=Gigaspora margarita TaxID=4874 RepID=A0ABM8W4X7_GIGMA|nr:39849_t:CDS:1 [Gigaspora margarita]